MANYYFIFLCLWCSAVRCQQIKLGILFDKESIKEIREFDLIWKKHQSTQIYFVNKTLDFMDSFSVSNEICDQLENGVYGILGVSEHCALSTIKSYSNQFQLPFIIISGTTGLISDTEPDAYQLFMKPVFIQGILDVIQDKMWGRVFFFYNSDEGLLRLQELLNGIHEQRLQLLLLFNKVIDGVDCYQRLLNFYNTETEELRILIDLPIKETETTIYLLKQNNEVNKNRFHFLLTDLGISEIANNISVVSKGMNLTGFQFSPSEDFSDTEIELTEELRSLSRATYSDILVRDAVRFLSKALMYNRIPRRGGPKVSCRHGTGRKVDMKPGRQTLMDILRRIEIDGESGRVQFDRYGRRIGFKLQLKEILVGTEMAKIADWSPEVGLRKHRPEHIPHQSVQHTKTVIQHNVNITTIKISPYLTVKKEFEKYVQEKENARQEQICGKEMFYGYSVELSERIAEKLNLTYELCLVFDGNYGKELSNKSWDGMIGELMQKKADIAIAPITITSDREKVVDFTKPFMSLGISILIKKPVNKGAHIFSFMDPLSREIWMCILFAYVGVSVVLFLVSRFSPTEWKVEDTNITNDFTISNSLWYSLGAFMQQGCDISPTAVSGRIVGSVWWFFTLIIISSYTANLAAFLTVDRMNSPIESVEDLAKQTKIQYGVMRNGATHAFFNKSKFALYERMYAYMMSNEKVFVDNNELGIQKVRNSNGKYAFLLESTKNEYTNMQLPCDTMKVGSNLDSKGYGIATPINSQLRDPLTLAVLALRESGELAKLKKKWWDDNSRCPKQKSDDDTQAELTLENVAGIFYILSGGLTLSVIIAAFEFLYKSILDSKKSKTTFGSMIRCKARLSFRGSDSSAPNTPLKRPTATYTYTGPSQLAGFDPYVDTNTHTEV